MSHITVINFLPVGHARKGLGRGYALYAMPCRF